MQNIYYTEITDVNLTVGIIDKMFKVGDISLHLKSGGVRVVYDVSDPYALVSKLQKIVNDIKADVYFPNELRPQENNGYQTKYLGIDSKLKSSSLEKGYSPTSQQEEQPGLHLINSHCSSKYLSNLLSNFSRNFSYLFSINEPLSANIFFRPKLYQNPEFHQL